MEELDWGAGYGGVGKTSTKDSGNEVGERRYAIHENPETRKEIRTDEHSI